MGCAKKGEFRLYCRKCQWKDETTKRDKAHKLFIEHAAKCKDAHGNAMILVDGHGWVPKAEEMGKKTV
jgi:hypothetical protein